MAKSAPAKVFPYEQREDVVIVRPSGDALNIEESQLVREINALHKAIGQPDVRHVVVDLSGTPYLGSLVIGALLALAKKVRDAGGHAVMCAAKAGVFDSLEIMRVPDVVPYHDDLETALAVARDGGG